MGLTSYIAFLSRFGAVIFIAGKMLRFAFFLLFVLLLVGKTRTILTYSLWQVILFFFTFNLVDIAAQLFLREVYRFRSYVVNGTLDYILSKPFSPLFRVLFGGSDVLDIPMFIIAVISIIVAASNTGAISFSNILLYVVLIFNAFIITLSFHIAVLALGVLTTEVDSTLFLYRDLTQMGRLPVDIYHEPLRSFLTFVIPIGIMMTFPVKALMGFITLPAVAASFITGGLLFFISLRFWRFALKHYASASS